MKDNKKKMRLAQKKQNRNKLIIITTWLVISLIAFYFIRLAFITLLK